MTHTSKRAVTKAEERRTAFEQTSEFAKRSTEKDRIERTEKTERLRAIRLAQQTKDN